MKQDLGFYLKRIDESLYKMANENFKAVGMTMAQAKVLNFLHSKPGKTATQKEMEIFFEVSHPTISGILKRMEQKGMITTKFLHEGRTSKQVTLAAKGEKNFLLAEQQKNASKKILLKGFTKAETEQLETMLQRLYINLRNEIEKPVDNPQKKTSSAKTSDKVNTPKKTAAKKPAGKTKTAESNRRKKTAK